jgi:hypothetical protein
LGLWPCADAGGNQQSHDLDKLHDNWDKLALNFTPHTPMAYWKKQEKHLCFFGIDVHAAALYGVLFTNTNATSTTRQHKRLEGMRGLDLVNFNAIRAIPRPGDTEGWKRPVQAEVLIPDRLPLTYVKEIFFVSEASRDEAGRLWGSTAKHPSFTVDPAIFTDFSVYSAATYNFPFLISTLLTDQHVDRTNLSTARPHKNQFVRSSTHIIHLLSKVYALTGTKAEAIRLPTGDRSTTLFSKSFPVLAHSQDFSRSPTNWPLCCRVQA